MIYKRRSVRHIQKCIHDFDMQGQLPSMGYSLLLDTIAYTLNGQNAMDLKSSYLIVFTITTNTMRIYGIGTITTEQVLRVRLTTQLVINHVIHTTLRLNSRSYNLRIYMCLYFMVVMQPLDFKRQYWPF